MLGEFIWTILVFVAGSWAGAKYGGPKQLWSKLKRMLSDDKPEA